MTPLPLEGIRVIEFTQGEQEFEIDDVRYLPTPGTAGVLGIGALGLARRRRR